jgi:restriction endonuclease S subunit
VPYLNVRDIKDGYIDFSDTKFISEKVNEILKKSQMKEGQIILTMAGTIGNVAVAHKIPTKVNSNQATAKITLKKGISPYFITAFLNCYYGKNQIIREIVSSVQPNIFLFQIKNFKVPTTSGKKQKEVEKIYIQGLNELENSKLLYRQAETLLLDELKIKNLDLEDKLSYVVKLSEAEEQKREDAEYFQPKYKNLIEHIRKNCNGVCLGELVSIKKGIEPGAESYLDAPEISFNPPPPLYKGGNSSNTPYQGGDNPPNPLYQGGILKGGGSKQFIRVSSMSKYGINDNDQKYLSDDLYNELKKDYEPKKGEILLTKDASPGIAYVLKNDIEGIISGGVLRLKLNPSTSSGQEEIEDEYLALCLNSLVGQMQAERDAGGSVIMHWKPEQIKNVMIPILSKQTQQKISSLVRESFEKRIKAKELLEEAKRKVEEMIENN